MVIYVCHPGVLVISGIDVTRIFLGEEFVEFLHLLLHGGSSLVITRLQHHFELIGILVEKFAQLRYSGIATCDFQPPVVVEPWIVALVAVGIRLAVVTLGTVKTVEE